MEHFKVNLLLNVQDIGFTCKIIVMFMVAVPYLEFLRFFWSPYIHVTIDCKVNLFPLFEEDSRN